MAVSALCATTASTEALNGTSLGETVVCSSPPCPKSYTQNRTVPVSKRNALYGCITQRK